MTEQELRRIVREAVHETLLRMGMTADAPSDMQADMIYLRKARKGNEEVYKWMRRSVVGVGISSALFALWEGVKHLMRGNA